MSSIDDPVLKELLAAFREDVHHIADDILRGVWVQAAISIVAFFLALSSVVRLFVELYFRFQPFPRGPAGFEFGPNGLAILIPEIVLDVILFGLSLYAFRSYLLLRRRYSRLWSLAEKLGR